MSREVGAVQLDDIAVLGERDERGPVDRQAETVAGELDSLDRQPARCLVQHGERGGLHRVDSVGHVVLEASGPVVEVIVGLSSVRVTRRM